MAAPHALSIRMHAFRAKLRIRHLEIVRMVAERGNLSRAAADLHITQSGLSRAIAEIEAFVGGALFERTAKGMVCTPLGLSLHRHAGVLLGDMDKAEADLQAVLHGELGNLSIGCFSFFSGWPLADAVRDFCVAHPRVAVSIQIGMHERLISDLDAGALDVLISRFPASMDPQTYRTMVLSRDPIVLTCAPGHPLAARATVDLQHAVRHPWVTALQGSRVRSELEERLRHAGLPLPAMVGALSLEFGLEMLSDARHLLTLSGSVAGVLERRGRLRVLPVELGLDPMPLAAIWRRDRSSTRQVRAFCSLLAKVIAAEGEAPPS
jgi:DNA-binding transcriptional LysR family regulator